MTQTYTRQSSFSDGDTITAALFNDEYNQLVNAFAYSTTSSSTGHQHDGTAAEGGNIHTIGDLDFLNKIVADSTNNRWGVFVEVSSSAVEQIRIQDGAIVPVTDNDIDLGTSSVEFKDAFFDGTVTTDALVADTADINGGTVDGATVGANSASSGAFTTITASGTFVGSSTVQGTTITATTAFVPDASDGAALGTSALEFSDLFLADGAVINFGDDQDVSLTHVADAGLLLSSTDQLQFGDSGTYIYQSADGVLDLVSDTEIEINATTIDINGALDLSGAATIGGAITGSSTVQGTTITATTAFVPDASDGAALGTSSLEFSDLFLADGAVINFGDDQEVSLTHVADTGLLLSSDDRLQFGDSGTYIFQSADGVLDLVSDTEIEINATTIDINGNVDVSGTYTGGGLMTTGGNIVIPDGGNIGAASDTDSISISSGGVVTMNQIPVFSAGINVSGGTIAGTLATAAQGNVTSLGTLTALTVDNVAINGATIGHTGDTDLLTLASGILTVAGEVSMTTLDIGGTNVAATAAELNIMDGGTSASSTTLADADRVVVNDDGTMKQVALTDFETYFESSIDTFSTIDINGGSIDGATLGTNSAITQAVIDDIDLNGKVITMTGSASDTAVFTAGTNGTLSIVTTDAAAAAANIQITADGTVDIDSAGVLTLDSGAAINLEPAAGSAILLDGTISVDAGVVTGATSITSTAFVGTLSTAAQTNITSVGTLSSLAVGAITSTGASTITTADNTDTLQLISTDADANVGPNLRLYRNSSSPADDDFLGAIEFEGRNDNSQDFIAARLFAYSTDVSDGTEDAVLQLGMMKGGSQHLAMEVTPNEFVINNGSVDLDFRVESDGNANMLFVDGGNDRVGIGGTPSSMFHIVDGAGTVPSLGGGTNFIIQNNDGTSDVARLNVIGGAAGYSTLHFGDASAYNVGGVIYNHSNDNMTFDAGGSTALTLTSSATTVGGTLGVTGATTLSALTTIDQNSNATGLLIDSEGTSASSLVITDVATTGHVVEIADSDALTTGSIMRLKSNSSSTGTRNLVSITNDNSSATGTTALKIQQDAAAVGISIDSNANNNALYIDAENTTDTAIQVTCDTLTSGAAATFYSNSDDTTARKMVVIKQDHVSATGAIPLYILNDSTGDAAKFESTDASANANPVIDLYRNSASPADSDLLGKINFTARNDNSQDVVYANMFAYNSDVSDGTENGNIQIGTMLAGTLSSFLQLGANGTVFNQDSKDVDFTVESNNNANMIFVDGGNDHVNIGTSSDLGGAFNVSGIMTLQGTGSYSQLNMKDSAGNADGYIYAETSSIGFLDVDGHWGYQLTGNSTHKWYSDNVQLMELEADGDLKLINTGTGSGAGPSITLYRNSASPADNDLIGSIKFDMEDDAGDTVTAVSLISKIADASNTTEDGWFEIDVMTNGSALSYLNFYPGEISFNDDSNDIDFRVESNDDTHMLFVDGGNNRVGIGKAPASNPFEVEGAASFDSHVIITGDIRSTTSGTSNFRAGVNAGNSIASGGNYNVVVGDEAGTALTLGDNNVAVGYGALATEDGHGNNVAIGYAALNQLNAGADGHNTAVGKFAGYNVTTGIQNTIIGSSAFDLANASNENVAIGYAALTQEVKGHRNTAVGTWTLAAQQFGTSTNSYNVAVGYDAGNDITTGVENTLIGSTAGDKLTDADYNVAIGNNSLGVDTLGSRTIAIGAGALVTQNFTTATDTYNIAVGHGAGGAITTGTFNTLIGGLAGDALINVENNVAIGFQALSQDTYGSKSVAIGRNVLYAQNFTTATDSHNTAIGYVAGSAITTGVQNTIIGGEAGDALIDADYNTAVGKGALGLDTYGSKSTAIGTNALTTQNFTTAADSFNTAVGHGAGQILTTATGCTFVGTYAGDGSDDGAENTAIGYYSLSANHGDGNVALGAHAGRVHTGGDSTFLGYNTGRSTTGSQNTLVGRGAGYDTTALTTGSQNTIVGMNCRTSAADSTNQIVLGYDGAGNANNSVVFCNAATDSAIAFGGTSVTAPSDERYKEEIQDATAGLSFINDLRPVTFKWKKEKDIPSDHRAYVEGSETRVMLSEGEINHGFIAQEVKEAIDSHPEIHDGFDMWSEDDIDGRQRLGDGALIPMLTKAVQELSATVETLQAEIELLKGE